MSTTISTSASLFLHSLNLKLPSFTKPTHSSLSLSLSSTLTAKPITISIPSSSSLSLRFLRKVADVSPDFGVFSGEYGGDEEEEEVEEEEQSFSPDLKLFVGNLPFSVDSAQLAGLFEGAGNVQMVEVVYDKMSGRSRGFGFVTMSTQEEVEAAAEQFNGYELEGRALRVNYGPPPPKKEFSSPRGPRFGARPSDSNRLYVGNLSWDVDDSALESFFGDVGNVSEARVVCDRDSGRSRGFGFVSYSSAEEAKNAIESLNGVDLVGRPIRVSYAEDKPRRY